MNAILHGCNGKMGAMISSLAAEDPSLKIVAGVDIDPEHAHNSYPVYHYVSEVNEDASVVIDFSNASAIDRLLEDCLAKKLALVLCTTGLSDEQLAKVRAAASDIAILRSANMSLGINTLFKVLKDISPALSEAGFDIEIVEKHHRQKVDAPSGTAIALADAVNASLSDKQVFVFDRSTRRAARPTAEIGISAVRGGTIVGDHDVIFAGTDEVITLSHRAYSRAVFGNGAIAAAKFLDGKAPGMYDMSDVIG